MDKTLKIIGESINEAGNSARNNFDSWSIGKVVIRLREIQAVAEEDVKLQQELINALSIAVNFIEDKRIVDYCLSVIEKYEGGNK